MKVHGRLHFFNRKNGENHVNEKEPSGSSYVEQGGGNQVIFGNDYKLAAQHTGSGHKGKQTGAFGMVCGIGFNG